MKRLFVVVFSIVLIVSDGFCQKALKKRADDALKANEYSFAINNYKSLFAQTENEDPLKPEIAYKIGYCFKKISKPLDAQLWFEKAIDLKYDDPIVYLYCADVQRMNENFEKAISYYEKYRTLVPTDEIAEKGIESCRIARQWIKNPTSYIVSNLVYVNSEYSDYAPFYLDDGMSKSVYFSSTRPNSTGDVIHGGSGQNFSDIYVSKEDAKGAWSNPVSISDIINTANEEGAPSITKDGKFLFYTQCEYGSNDSYCKIMSATKIGSSWDKPVELKFNDSKDTCDYVHPSISKDGLTLYLASNRPGGYGGYDIWFCTRSSTNEKWGKLKNAGDVVNTERTELFPYIREDNTLFFASDGHIGMGGLDLYRVNKDAKGKDYILNLMSPMNSPSDDFGITYKDSLEEGFFSSNRTGTKGFDDIFHFTISKLSYIVKGQIINDGTNEPIPNAIISIVGSDGTSIEVSSDNKGYYEASLNPQTNYVLIATRDKYLNCKYKMSTYGHKENKDFNVNLYMTEMSSVIEVPNILYDVNKWDIRPESIVSLNKLYETLNDNPNIIIELSSNTDYRVSSKMSNEELSQLRAQSIVDYLIARGIDEERLKAKGNGATNPKTIDKKYADMYSFLKIGDVLTPEYIKALADHSKQEICHQINRRTEFRVLSNNYKK